MHTQVITIGKAIEEDRTCYVLPFGEGGEKKNIHLSDFM
jgi:hypothetical protein